MIINNVTHYTPDIIIPNETIFAKYGITNEKIISKGEIKQRRLTQFDENTNSMTIKAVTKALPDLPFPINEIDLIIGATYTPYEIGGKLASAVQKQNNIGEARCFTLDSACSSFVNAIEIVDRYFANNKTSKALIVISENNTAYIDESDKNSCFLLGKYMQFETEQILVISK